MIAPLFGDFAVVKKQIDERQFQRFFTTAPDLIKVGAEGYIHGFICVRPPCGDKPAKMKTADLAIQDNGSVVHQPSGYAVGHIRHIDDGKYVSSHADGHATKHGDRDAALRTIAGHYNTGKTKVNNTSTTTAPKKVKKPASLRQSGTGTPSVLALHGVPDVNLDDVLPANKASQLRELVKSTSAAKADELDRLKNEAQRSILKNKFGLSDVAIDGIAGDATKSFTQMSDTETKFQPLTWAASSWSRYGMKSWFAKSFSRGMAMDKPPEVRDSDFEYSDKKSSWGENFTRKFTDQSDEAQKRREDAMAYFGTRTQQMYTQMMLKEAKIKQSPSVRYVYGDYADNIVKADNAKEPWNAATNDVTSWMQPQAAAEKRVQKFIGDQLFITSKNSNVIRLSSDIPQVSMIMHWRLEGHLRSDGLREVVSGEPGGSSINSNNTTITTIQIA